MLDLLSLPFFQRALLIGVILGVIMALLGVLVVLRRLSFFADAIGHSALTGIALGLLVNITPFWGALGFAVLIAAAIVGIRYRSNLHIDTLLGVFFPAAMALGVILVQLTPGYQADLIALLFGDILTVSAGDVGISLALGAIVAIVLVWGGKRFISITFDEALAKTEGIPVVAYELLFLLLVAAVIALAIKFVGIILVTALFVIPAASAQNLAGSLAGLFGISVVISLLAVIGGMFLSAAASLPSGPTIVLVAAGIFAISFFARQKTTI